MRHVVCFVCLLAPWAAGCPSTLDRSQANADAAADAPGDGAASSDLPLPDVSLPIDRVVPVDGTPRVDVPEVQDAATDAPNDDAGPMSALRGDRICGVSVTFTYGPPAARFWMLYARHLGASSELHLARVETNGSVAFDRTIERSTTVRHCVARGSLAGWYAGSGTQRLAVAWHESSGSTGLPRAAVFDTDGAQVATLRFDPGDTDAQPLDADNLTIVSSVSGINVFYEGGTTSDRVLRARTFDLSRPPEVADGRAVYPLRGSYGASLATMIVGPLVIGERYVAYAHRRLGRQVLGARNLSSIETALGGEIDVATTLENPAPVFLGPHSSGNLVFRGGVRDQSLVVAALTASTPAARRMADDTAWFSTDAALDPGGFSDLWISHGLAGGYNHRVLLAPIREADPQRCVLFEGASEQSVFRQVARARLGGRQQLIAAIEARSSPDGRSTEVLHMRVVGDGEDVCARTP